MPTRELLVHGVRDPEHDQLAPEVVEEELAAACADAMPRSLEADVLVSPLEGGVAPFWARADEISEGGLFVGTRKRLPPDALLLVEVVFRDPALPKLRLDAHVVHSIPGAGFGCCFVGISEQDKRRLRAIIADRQQA